MTFHNTPLLDDVELLMVLDGEADPEVAMHVSQCPHCSQRAAQLASAQQAVTHRLFRATCPSALELGEYHQGLLPAASSALVQQHLATCPHCTQEFAQLVSFMDAPDPYLRTDPLAAVKQGVKVLVARLVNGPQVSSLFGPPALAPALAGLRGAADEPLIYEAEDVQVSIEIQGDAELPGHLAIFGLVTSLDDGHAIQAELWRDQQRLASAQVDVIGNFTFGGLAPGEYELFISSDAFDIHVQSLRVGPG